MPKPEFVYTTYIETTPEKLWQALTDGDFTERYWFGARLRSDWKVGSSFEMVRSDGTVSGALTQSVPSGVHQVQLPLRWTVTGQGNFQGTATLKITSPGSATGTAVFNYSCE